MVQNGLDSSKFESDTLRRVIGETSDGELALNSRKLARYQALFHKADDSITEAQYWPYDSLREGIFWRPLRVPLHILKALRIEWLAIQVRLGLRKKADFESQAIDRLEEHQREAERPDPEVPQGNPMLLLEHTQKEADQNVQDYERSIQIVRQDAEASLAKNYEADFKRARAEQDQEFKDDIQELEDRILQEDIEQRRLISNLLGEKEAVLDGIRQQLAQAEENRKKATGERMSRIWELLEDEK